MICYCNIYDDGKKGLNFRCNDDKEFKKYIEIWKKIGSSVNRKEFNNDLIYKSKNNNNTYKKTKIKEFGDVMKNFCYYNKVLRVPEEGAPYKCLALIK